MPFDFCYNFNITSYGLSWHPEITGEFTCVDSTGLQISHELGLGLLSLVSHPS